MSEKKLAVVVPAYNEATGIEKTLRALSEQRFRENVLHILVDNASTDDTAFVAEQFAKQNPDFPLEIIEEPEKGTGCAADTGFRHAIKQGCSIVGRVDADTLPRPGWTESIVGNFSIHSNLQLLGGRRHPRTDDEWYRWRDKLLWPVGVSVGICLSKLAALVDARFGTGSVAGHNMATRASAYEHVGGFPRTAIDDIDEDRAYENRIKEAFGKRSIKLDSNMLVETSMRKVRSLGYGGLFFYRMFPAGVYRRSLAGSVDVR